jgi:oligopeptide transport system permease protein
MRGYLIRKFLILLASLWCVATATFFLMHSLPGDPFVGEQPMPPEVHEALRRYYGLDRPLLEQYFSFLGRLARGDLGASIAYHQRPVAAFIQTGFPVSAALGLEALSIALPAGLLLGTFAALRPGKAGDHAAIAASTLAVSVPNFVLASLLQFVFCVQLPWLPVARWGTFAHTVLPALSLAALPTAFIARLIRAGLVEALRQDYAKTALAKGLSPLQIALFHGLRNAALPALTYLGPICAHILTGSFVVERIFAIPGLGQWMIHSILSRDYPMIGGLALFYSALLMGCVFLVDLAYGLVDPRIRIPGVAHAK